MEEKNGISRWGWVVAVVVIILIIGLYISSKTTKNISQIKVGALLSLKGSLAIFGEDVLNALEIARKELKSESVDFEIIYENSESDPKIALSAIRRLIDVEKVPLVIAGPGSSIALAVAPVFNEAGVLFMPISSTPKLNLLGDYIFKLDVDVDIEVKKMTEYFIAKNIKRVAVLFDSSSDTHVTGKNIFVDLFDGKSGDVVAVEGFDGKTQGDYRTQIARLKNNNPEAIYLFTSHKQGGIAVKQMRELGLNSQIFSWSVLNGSEFFEVAGNYSDGVIISEQLFSCLGTEQMRAYCQSYRDAYNNREPIKYGAIAYDMLHIIADTLKDQGSMSNEDITKRIQSAFTNKTYTGITGSFSFDNNGNITERSMELRIAKDGQFVKLGE